MTNTLNSLDEILHQIMFGVTTDTNSSTVWTFNEAKAAINKTILEDVLGCLPKNYAAKVGLNVAELWNSMDATDGYNQCLKDVRQLIAKRYGGAE